MSGSLRLVRGYPLERGITRHGGHCPHSRSQSAKVVRRRSGSTAFQSHELLLARGRTTGLGGEIAARPTARDASLAMTRRTPESRPRILPIRLALTTSRDDALSRL